MYYTESYDQKLGGTNTLLVPPTKKLGGLVSPGPHGCCAYGYTNNDCRLPLLGYGIGDDVNCE